jgi:hypothetical protein
MRRALLIALIAALYSWTPPPVSYVAIALLLWGVRCNVSALSSRH